MSYQNKSQAFSVRRQLGRGQPLGEIFFATDSAVLGTDDEKVIQSIASAVRLLASSKRVELVTNGFTDHRGSREYNVKLGKRRANAVRDRLSALLRNIPNSSVITSLSLGESRATQGTEDKNELANDRRVVIWDQLPEFWKEEKSAKRSIERVRRLTSIHLKKESNSVAVSHPDVRPGHETTAKLVQYVFDHFFAGVYEEFGTPKRTTYTQMDGSFRVSDIYIDVTTRTKIGYMADQVTSDTHIRYVWGPPKSHVVIRKSVFSMGSEVSRSENKMIPRKEADRDPFMFPLAKM